MSISVGPGGYLELFSPGVGAKRKVKIHEFVGRATAGDINDPKFDVGFQPIAVVNVEHGILATASFSDTGNTTGTLKQLDTGPAGHVHFAIYTDTGV